MDPRRGLPYLPGVDGLRALAVVAVFVHHAHAAWLPGGYLGVDLFFVISGFVITRSLLGERDSGGRIELRAFWRRRARRLLPAAYLLILVVIATYQLSFAGEAREVARLGVAAAGYAANWQLIWRDAPYFESIGPPSPLQHLWSLAVEEQFYLLWPPLLVLLLRLRGRALAASVCVALAATSLAWTWQLRASGAGEARLYYGSDTHAAGLLLGAALACAPGLAEVGRARLARRGADALAVAALAGLGALAWQLAAWRAELYPWGFAMTALLSAGAIAGAAQPGSRSAQVLGVAPLRWLGLRSYSVYLWHWPVLVVSNRAFGAGVPEPVLVLAQGGATLALAELSYRVVERPVRSGALGRWWSAAAGRRWWWGRAALGAGATACVLLALLLVARGVAAPPATPPHYLATAALAGRLSAEPVELTAWPEAAATPAPQAELPPGDLRAAPALVAAANAPPDATSVPQAPPNAAGEQRPAAGLAASTVVQASSSVAAAVAPPGVGSGAPVFAVGDSVMLGAAQALARAFGTIDLDAAAGRDTRSVIAILRQRRDAGTLPPLLVVHTGDNGPLTGGQLDELLQVVAGPSQVLLVNVRVPQPWERANNGLLASAVGRHAHARLVDWHEASTDRPEWFWADGMHLRPEGALAFAALVRAAAGGAAP
jgi:peptidoglycan/LPS O-acetylase OafA/YrhL